MSKKYLLFVRRHFQFSQSLMIFVPLLFVILASARVANPIESGKRYPWLACLLTQEEKKPYAQAESQPELCTGSVISKGYQKHIRLWLRTSHG